MSKKVFVTLFLVILVCVLGASLSSVLAKNTDDSDDQILPEQPGIYDVPGRPDLKLKVFVHNPKDKQNARPSPVVPPVCNLQDPDSTVTIGSAGWHLADGTTVYTLNSGSVPSAVGTNNLATMATDAFNRWAGATGNKVVFSRDVSNTTVAKAALDGKNIITWGRASGTALAITYTWYDRNTGVASEVDTIMNNKFSWSWAAPGSICVNANTYDAQDILTHELGHWMGLNDYYAADYQNATMYGYGSKAEIKKDTLSTGDVNGITAIYK